MRERVSSASQLLRQRRTANATELPGPVEQTSTPRTSPQLGRGCRIAERYDAARRDGCGGHDWRHRRGKYDWRPRRFRRLYRQGALRRRDGGPLGQKVSARHAKPQVALVPAPAQRAHGSILRRSRFTATRELDVGRRGALRDWTASGGRSFGRCERRHALRRRGRREACGKLLAALLTEKQMAGIVPAARRANHLIAMGHRRAVYRQALAGVTLSEGSAPKAPHPGPCAWMAGPTDGRGPRGQARAR